MNIHYKIKNYFSQIVIAIAVIAIVYVMGIDAIIAKGYVFLDLIKKDPVIAVAAIALFLTIWQGLQARRHNRLSLRPLLEFSGYIGDGDKQKNKKNSKFEVTLVNRGVGPAIIKNFVLKIDGKEKSRNDSQDYHDSLEKLLKNFKPLMNTHISSGNAVQAGDKIVVLRFKYNAKADKIDFINKVEILVEYQSIYKDKILSKKYKNEHRLDGTEF